MGENPLNLYVHFPFCRRKCAYCSLYSRVGVSEQARRDYVADLAAQLSILNPQHSTLNSPLSTVYFGGGSPAFCDLCPLAASLGQMIGPVTEFTVELNPLDVTAAKLEELKSIGVNRISMGVQSVNDRELERMGRGYTFEEAAKSFALVKRYFDNAGIDLIVGFSEEFRIENEELRIDSLATWGLKHCSVYALQNERGLKDVADDETTMDGLRFVGEKLKTMGLQRYEISNYAIPGCECRHNLAVWRGEDYVGLGEGACGRVGLARTFGGKVTATMSAERDEVERRIFRLRTRDGLDAGEHPEWLAALTRFEGEKLLIRKGETWFLTNRGMEVCDTILEELV